MPALLLEQAPEFSSPPPPTPDSSTKALEDVGVSFGAAGMDLSRCLCSRSGSSSRIYVDGRGDTQAVVVGVQLSWRIVA